MTEIHIDNITIYALDRSTVQKIDEIHSMLQAINGTVNSMADTADQILESVGRMRTKVESLEALTDRLFGLYNELRDDPAKLQQVLDTVAQIEAGADAAITRNTPEEAGGGTDTGGGTEPAGEPTGTGGTTPADVRP